MGNRINEAKKERRKKGIVGVHGFSASVHAFDNQTVSLLVTRGGDKVSRLRVPGSILES